MDMVTKECAYRGIDFINYIRNAATAAMKHAEISASVEASKGQTGNELKRIWPATFSTFSAEGHRTNKEKKIWE